MLTLTRRPGESIVIDSPIPHATGCGEHVTVTVLGVKGNQVCIGIAAPDDVTILREELVVGPRPIARGNRKTTPEECEAC